MEHPDLQTSQPLTIAEPKGETYLIADDDEFFRMALRTILAKTLGAAAVIEAASLDEAVERLSETGNVCLALFDLAMPGMKSAASLRAVREHFPDMKVAMVSASKRRSDILLALEAGAHGYIPKSFGITELGEAIKRIRSGSIYIPPSVTDLSGEEDAPNVLVGRMRASERPGLHDGLTPRQGQVLDLIIQGRSNKDIARELGLGEGTVKVHVAALFRVMGVTSRSALVTTALRRSSSPSISQAKPL